MTENQEFEAAYRARFFASVLFQTSVFYLDENGEYQEAKVFTAFEMWKEGRHSVANFMPKAITVWKDGGHKKWQQGDAVYAESDPDWLTTIRLDATRDAAAAQHLSSLLARIHRDGGQYENLHGTEKAVFDADLIISTLNTTPADQEHVDLPNCFEIARMEEAGIDWKADPEPKCTCAATVGVPHAESCPVTQWGREQFRKSGESAYAQPPQNAADHIEAQSVRDAALDSERLDYLDKRNARANARNRTTYGWRLNENHNRIALEDHAFPAVSVREAIDQAMKDVPLKPVSDEVKHG